MTSGLDALSAFAGGVVAIFALYLLILALAAAAGARSAEPSAPRRRVAILVPAYDEQELIGRCIRSLLAQDYPRALYRVVVIADNCTDRTASVAAEAGAEVLVRTEPGARGKGRALRWAVERLLGTPNEPDAIAVVDADSVADAGMLSALVAEMDRGHSVVQADYSLLVDRESTTRMRLVAAAFLLFHRVRFGGRARLGLSASLVGNGMLFASRVLREHPWSAFSAVEDLEHSIHLRLARVHIRFAPAAHVMGPGPASRAGEVRQRMRWEGGRFHVVRIYLPRLLVASLARRDASLLDAALDLATPPLGLLAIGAASGAVVAVLATVMGLLPTWAAAPWIAAVAAIGAFVLIGLCSARAPRYLWSAVATAPAYLGWKIVTYAALSRGFDPNRWDRSDRQLPGPGRVRIAGVPIDPVGMGEAVQCVRSAIGAGRLFQVATVNLDFLVGAQKDPGVLRIFHTTDLNLADGSPIVWLARLLGVPLPGRVAGADLVPALADDLSRVGGRLFLLGGEDGTAAAAAARLQARYPALQIAGTYEPARSAIADMNNDEILARIRDSEADVLLVAFGHPKQELWIDMHRSRLPVSVAIGVGCVFDLIAGKSRRAPRWMQNAGLEWLYRLVREPRRLAGRYASDAAWLLPVAARVLRARLAGGVVETA